MIRTLSEMDPPYLVVVVPDDQRLRNVLSRELDEDIPDDASLIAYRYRYQGKVDVQVMGDIAQGLRGMFEVICVGFTPTEVP